MNKQTQEEARSLISTWRRGTSNTAVSSHVRLSQVTERSWQTKPELYVDANESHCLTLTATLRFAELLCALCFLWDVLGSSVSVRHKLHRIQADFCWICSV